AAFEVATLSQLDRVRLLTEAALKAASLSSNEIDELVLTGGGAGIPSVQQTVREFAPNIPVTILTDPNAASHGAIVWANLHPRASHSGPKMSLQEVNAVDVGIATGRTPEGNLRYSRMIAANTPLPCGRSKFFGTQQHAQDSLRLPLTCLNELARNPVTPLGECHIWYHSLGQYSGTQLKLHFQLNSEGRLAIFAEPQSTGSRVSLDIQRPVGLSEEQCVRWRDWMDTAILCGNL
ncbi:MAG: Hsp70 family protein, partial [Planctomycetota bacterium]|nr:Hsp70 family protein [Planctomycetota bacterium]